MAPYTLEEVEQDIYNHYRFFYSEVGSTVTPREEGQLGSLWALYDLLVEDLRGVIPGGEFEREYGRGNQARV